MLLLLLLVLALLPPLGPTRLLHYEAYYMQLFTRPKTLEIIFKFWEQKLSVNKN